MNIPQTKAKVNKIVLKAKDKNIPRFTWTSFGYDKSCGKIC